MIQRTIGAALVLLGGLIALSTGVMSNTPEQASTGVVISIAGVVIYVHAALKRK